MGTTINIKLQNPLAHLLRKPLSQKTLTFPIKGTFYYDAHEAYRLDALCLNAPLILVAEPFNKHDARAIQLWDASGTYLLGYVPKQLTAFFHARTLKSSTTTLASMTMRQNFFSIQCQSRLPLPFWKALQARFTCFWLHIFAPND